MSEKYCSDCGKENVKLCPSCGCGICGTCDGKKGTCGLCVSALPEYQAGISEENHNKQVAQWGMAESLAKSLGWDGLIVDGVHGPVVEMYTMFAYCNFDVETGDVTIHCEDAADAEDFAMCFPTHKFKLTLAGGLKNWTLMQFVEIAHALVGKYIFVSEGAIQPAVTKVARDQATAYERDPDGTRDRKSEENSGVLYTCAPGIFN
jgi:hypothetical protein